MISRKGTQLELAEANLTLGPASPFYAEGGEPRHPAGWLSFGASRNTPVVKGYSIVRVEPDRLIEILQRPLEVAFGAPRKRETSEKEALAIWY